LITNNPNPIDANKLEMLYKATGRRGPVLIMTHHNPDPDGLAAGYGLSVLLKQVWNIPSRLIYTGLVGRVENRAMLKYLTPDWRKVKSLRDIGSYSSIALVDTQPESGYNLLPKDIYPSMVFDHHQPNLSAMDKVKYIDLRPEIGATSTIIFQYLESAGVKLDLCLATALFYGLKTDTRGLSRITSKADEYAYFYLLAHVDHHKLSQVEQAQLPISYFRALDNALRSTMVYGKAVVTVMGHMHRPDLPAEIADLLIRLTGTKAALCMGRYDNTLNISLRTTTIYPYAGTIIHQVINGMGMSGGHRVMAGGQIPLSKKSDTGIIETRVKEKFLQAMGETGTGQPLLSLGE